MLLNQDKYNGYSHTKKGKNVDQVEKINDQVVENNSLDSDVDSMPVKIKKKKKKRCHKDFEGKEPQSNGNDNHGEEDLLQTCKTNKKEKKMSYQPVDNIVNVKKKEKTTIKQQNSEDASDISELTLDDLFPDCDDLESEFITKSKKKKRKRE